MTGEAPNQETGVSSNKSPAERHSPNWDDIRVFGIVARTGSLRRAAAWLGVQTPAISKRIEALEQFFKIKLFERTTQGMELTMPGRRAAAGAEEMALALHETIARLRPDGETRKEVKLAIGEGPADRWFIPYFLDLFLQQNPEVSLRLGTAPVPPNSSVSAFDVQIAYEPETSGNYQTVRVGKFHFILLASKRYVERHGLPETEADLKGHRFADVLPNMHSERGYLQALAGLEAPGSVLFSTNSSLAAANAVEAGVTIAALPSYIFLTSTEFVPVLPAMQVYEMGIYLNFSVAAAERPEVRALIDFLKQVVFSKRLPWFGDAFEPIAETWRTSHARHLSYALPTMPSPTR